MAWIAPVIDWTADDYYNYDDLNRVENNTDAVADIIETFASRPSLDVIKTDWDNRDFPFDDQINRIESNIDVLKNAMAEPTGWQTPVTSWSPGTIFDYEDANRLEINLSLLKTMGDSINAGLLYCGSFICGENTEL